jgi:tRNA threonylcarbamoyladenosine biosynthesis protein TsaE
LGESELAAPLPDGCHQRRTVDLSAAPNHPPIVGSSPPPGSGAAVLRWTDEADTEAFARRLAGHPQLADAFIELHGDLGAGKTTFVRHLLRALGVTGRIKSPTYAVVEPHQATGLAAWHFDFYRFDDPREWEDAGFRDVFDSPGLKLAEWPEKAAGLLPPADLVLRIALLPDGQREVRIEAGTARGRELLA